jgi:predicted nucleic acid-binding protein
LIIVDASVAIELVLNTPLAEQIRDRLFGSGDSLHAPHLIDVEVAQALRRLILLKQLTDERAGEALADFRSLNLERHPHGPYLTQVWALRHSLSAYDALYVALAIGLRGTLVTCDGKLARAKLSGVDVIWVH